MKKIITVLIAVNMLVPSGVSLVSAQQIYGSDPYVDWGATYTSSPTVDYGATYTSSPTVDYGATYTSSPVVNFGVVDHGAFYTSTPTVDNGATYTSTPTVNFGTTYSSTPTVNYDTLYTSTPTVDYGATFTSTPTVDYGAIFTSTPTVDYGATFTSTPTVDYGATYTSTPTVDYGTIYTSTPTVDYGTTYTSTPTVNYGTTYTSTPVVDYGVTYGNTGSMFIGSSYPTNYGSVSFSPVTFGSVTYGTTMTPSWTGVVTQTNNPIVTTTCPNGTTLVNGTCQINTITCPAGTTRQNNVCVPSVQCPNGTSLQNGVCVPQTQCPSGTTLVNGICQVNTTSCPQGTTLVNGTCQAPTQCPSGTTLVNGVCQAPTTCPSGTTLVNGTCQVNTTTCPQGSTLINGVCQAPITCPSGTTLQNGVCVGTSTTTCPAGTTLINGVCQINTTQCPPGSHLQNGVCQINATQCPAGSVFQNGICVVQNVVTNYTCPNGQVVSNLYACPVTYGQTSYTHTTVPVVYQTCWDGSVIPNTSVCPAQYKVCANGTSVPIHQQCYVPPTPAYVAPPVVKFNNVVTSPATQITISSARCNGIGLIAQGAQSTGWFEYGQTPNLGRQTNPAIIGSAATAPFSNVLTNLQPATTYYCRAVMQNQYGLVKGEIVHFTTKEKAVRYVAPKPVAPKAPAKKAAAPAKKSNEIVCVDGAVVPVGNKSAATMLNEGQKLIAVHVEKVSGDLTPGSTMTYRLVFKNLSDAMISGATIKITVPQEFTLTTLPAGGYDAATRTITFPNVTLSPYSENAIQWSGTVGKDAAVGKTVVTTAYILYTVPGSQVQDEVTAYTTSSIAAPADVGKLSGAKKVVGTAPTFLPNTLVEWLALIAILFIIFVLGRSIAQSYKKGGEAHH